MRWRIPLVVVLALFVAVSCDQKLVEPAADQVAEVTFDWTNNPDVGNLRIFRGETDWIACWTDPENLLRACHATLPLGAEPEPDCGLQEGGDLIEWQDVGLWVEPYWESFIHEVVKGEVFITIRDKNTTGDCFGNALVAEGWGNFMYRDNDIFGIGPELANANAWSLKGHSNKLEAPDGSRVIYNGHNHYTWNETYFRSFAKVNVH